MKKARLLVPIFIALILCLSVFIAYVFMNREKTDKPEIEHEHFVVLDRSVAPTCTETGLTEGTHCSVCGEILVRQETLAATGHDLGEWTQSKVPTCTEKGEERVTCKKCDYFETRDVASTGHKLGEWIQAQAPTCTEKGVSKATCKYCNYFETNEIAARGHNEPSGYGDKLFENKKVPRPFLCCS